jgi:hypothetical protein
MNVARQSELFSRIFPLTNVSLFRDASYISEVVIDVKVVHPKQGTIGMVNEVVIAFLCAFDISVLIETQHAFDIRGHMISVLQFGGLDLVQEPVDINEYLLVVHIHACVGAL